MSWFRQISKTNIQTPLVEIRGKAIGKRGYKYYLRLGAFAFLSLITAYATLNLGAAWIFIYILTHPGCPANPQPLPNLPGPEEYWLQTADGLEVRAWYYPSSNGAAVMAFGGMPGALGSNPPPVVFLVQEGYGVLQVDTRACARPRAKVTLGLKEIQEAAAGLAFLQSRPEVERIGVMGFSMGGAAAIRAAARHPGFAAVVAEGGYYNLGDHFVASGSPKPLPLEIFLRTIAASYWLQIGADPRQSSPIDDLPAISPRPVLLIYGEHELHSGHGDWQYQAARQPKELWVVPGGSHGRNYLVAKEEYERRVLDLFEKYLLVSKGSLGCTMEGP